MAELSAVSPFVAGADYGSTAAVLFANSSVGGVLGANDDTYGYWATDSRVAEANWLLAESDAYYAGGNYTAAAEAFLAAVNQNVDASHIEVLVSYLDNKAVSGKRDNQPAYENARCVAFGECSHSQEALLPRKLPWILSKANRIGRRFLGDLAQAFADRKFGNVLRGNNPRAYYYEGAYLSWHAAVGPWNPDYAAYVVRDGLDYSAAAQLSEKCYVSAIGKFNPVAWCLSDRGRDC